MRWQPPWPINALYAVCRGVAFEAQRDKEQLLIDRGEQYSRGDSLFVRKYNRFPRTWMRWKNTQSIRFLRQEIQRSDDG